MRETQTLLKYIHTCPRVCLLIWSSHNLKTIHKIETVQRWFTKLYQDTATLAIMTEFIRWV